MPRHNRFAAGNSAPRSFRRAALALAAAALFAPALQASSGPGVKLGSEFRVNSTTGNDQVFPDIAMDADGDAVIVWSGATATNNCTRIHTRTFFAGGEPSLVQVIHPFDPVRRYCTPAVAVMPGGERFFVWTEGIASGETVAADGVWMRRFLPSGSGVPLRVDEGSSGPGHDPDIAVSTSGRHVVVWDRPGTGGSRVWARHYSAGGNPADPFMVSRSIGEDPAVAIDDRGYYTVVWSQQEESQWRVYMRRYDSGGHPLALPQRVDASTCAQQFPDIAMARDGWYVVAWEESCSGSDEIRAKRFRSDGVVVGSLLHVNVRTTGNQSTPRVAMDADGDFVVAWTSVPQDGSGFGVYARRYTDGLTFTAGQEFRAHTYTTFDQAAPAIAIDADGEFAIAWMSFEQDGSGWGVYGQRWSGFENVDLAVALADSPDPVSAGTTIRYDALVSNMHPGSTLDGVGVATGVEASFGVTGGTLTGAAGTDWNCQHDAFSALCRYTGRLAPGQTAGLGFDVLRGTPGTVSGEARVSTQQWDAGPDNNAAEQSTTVTPDGTPDPFDFVDVTGAPLDSVVASGEITITGLAVAAQATVAGPAARIQVNGGAWGIGPLSVANGDRVRVRLRSATTVATARTATVTIGGISDDWTVTTAP